MEHWDRVKRLLLRLKNGEEIKLECDVMGSCDAPIGSQHQWEKWYSKYKTALMIMECLCLPPSLLIWSKPLIYCYYSYHQDHCRNMVAMEESSSSLKVQLMTPQGTAMTSASGDVTKKDNQVKLLVNGSYNTFDHSNGKERNHMSSSRQS